jgi:pyruvate dehydrogenase E2 component (dihydrolipoamide acetyltransferase)
MQTVTMPRLSLNDETSLLAEWYVHENDVVSMGDKLFCIETDKSTMDVESPQNGIVLKRFYGDNAVVAVLSPVCVIGEAGEAVPEGLAGMAGGECARELEPNKPPQTEAPATAEQSPERTTDGRNAAVASPRAKRLMAQNGVASLAGIAASGAEGRILEEDVLRYLSEGAHEPAANESTTHGEGLREVPFTKIRSVIAKNMLASLQSSAQLTMTAVFNAAGLQRARAAFKSAGGYGAGVTIGDLIAFGTIKTLTSYPSINAWSGESSYTEFDAVHLGIAVDTPRGLMVPTVQNAETRTLLDLSREIKTLADACRAGSIAPEKLKNGTFTISNIGAMGIQTFTPVLNPPQAGILGVGCIDYAVRQTPDGILCYPACHLSLTIDHRVIDGMPAARFLHALCETLEQIEQIL